MRTAERGLARLYRRFGVLGLLPAITVISVLSSAVACDIAVIVIARYGEVSLPDFWRFTLAAEAVMLVALGIGVALASRDLMTLLRWSKADPSPTQAIETWKAALQGPRRIVTWVGVAVVILEIGPVMWAIELFEWPLYSALLMMILIALIVAGNCIFVMFGIEFALRPLLEDVAGHLPVGFEPDARVLPLQVKALVAVPGAFIFGGLLVGAFVDTTTDFAARLATSLGLAAGTATIGVLLFLLVTRAFLRPIGDITSATERVGRGELTTSVPLLSADELGRLGISFNNMVAGLRERESLHSAMGAYIDPAIAERVAAEGAAISGEAAEVTVMFVDIVGFTALAEGAVPDEVVSDLNDFFEVVVPAIEHHGGHANKLLGDGLMAVFGVPSAMDDHADRALAAAREIQQGLDDRYERELKAGIGLNSGTVVVGSMGGGRKLDYTIIGDAVNVAARVEAYTRTTGDGILLTDATRALLENADGLEARGEQPLKGRAAPVKLWAVVFAR